ncbi:MAG: carbohydrate-binding family 9-like protein [Acidobacteria bacterium]|nr:carbohydrate-binding family 9-like protein [Acidobacteriota bacterium]
MIPQHLGRPTIVVALVCVMLCSCSATAQELPTYTVLKTRSPIRVDGRLDDPAWTVAPPVGSFVNNVDGSPSSLQTEARILYDDRFLYFAFKLADSNVWSTFRGRDEHLWTEEVVEVFLRADPETRSYIELEVNPLGTLIDIYLVDVRKPLPYATWNSAKIDWAVQVDGTVDGLEGDSGWTCELALPLEDVVPAPNIPPKPGDRWRLSLYRVERKPERASLAWSPTMKPDFHVPDRFGVIIFSDRLAP